MRRIWTVRRVGLLALVLAALGCSSGGGGASSTPTGPTGTGGSGAGEGTATVMLTDSPFSDAKAVLVTISEVSFHRSGDGGFTPLLTSSQTCDLKKLVNASTMLVTAPLPTGHYTQIRLAVSNATLYFDNTSNGPACAPSITAPAGRNAPLDIPSGEIKLNREFDVSSNNVTTLTLDFDGDRSINETGGGKFIMQPVIAIIGIQ